MEPGVLYTTRPLANRTGPGVSAQEHGGRGGGGERQASLEVVRRGSRSSCFPEVSKLDQHTDHGVLWPGPPFPGSCRRRESGFTRKGVGRERAERW